MIELIQIKPLNEAIIELMDNHGLSRLEQVGLLDLIKFDLAMDAREIEFKPEE